MPNPYWNQPAPHTKAKLELLRHYLGAWFSILASARRDARNHLFHELVYLDGFCGRGEYSDGQLGSPVVAVRHANKVAESRRDLHINIILVDKEQENISHLESLKPIKTPHPNVKITIITGSFYDTVVGIFDRLGISPDAPTFSFVDPYGIIKNPDATFAKLMRNQSSELFINFMNGYVNRFIRPGVKSRESFVSAIGSEAVNRVLAADDPIAAISCEYTAKLRAYGRYVRNFQMRDEKNVRDNAIFFCGNNSKGFKKVKEAMWKIDPVNGNEFSAFASEQRERQDDFLTRDPYLHDLKLEVVERFAGSKGVMGGELKNWADYESARFLYSHLRFVLENLVAEGTVAYDPPPSETRRRRKNTWPDAGSFSFPRRA